MSLSESLCVFIWEKYSNLTLQDLFSSGAIKSATDFQVYKEVAGLSGLDFAYSDNSAVYHTKVLFSSLLLRFWDIIRKVLFAFLIDKGSSKSILIRGLTFIV